MRRDRSYRAEPLAPHIKLVMCGYLGCRNVFEIDTRKGEPLTAFCGHHTKRMNAGIKQLVRSGHNG